MAPYNILVLTNRDSDNCGDLLIEASVISLIKAAMANIGIAEDQYTINSRAAGIISRKYMSTRDESLLEDARRTIKQADVVIFGGAPLFNYAYQNFYLRTIRTIELAQEYNVPVLFSSIGVEEYSESNPKSQELKKALHLPVVRQITTRDDISSVRSYLDGTGKPSSLVSDPAVFTDKVFEDALSNRNKQKGKGGKKTIGLVVTRAGIFKDNRIDFTESNQRQFWLDTIKEVQERGYDYRLFTTGHFSDEVFLDSLVRDKGIPASKVQFAVTSPEEMLEEITACDGILAYRLHANIAAYSYRIPAIGLTWNFKIPYFYRTVGYPERALSVESWKAKTVVDALDVAMRDGVKHDDEFNFSVYETLFQGLKGVFAEDSDAQVYSMEDLGEKLPRHVRTDEVQYVRKTVIKLRRTYDNYQKLSRRIARLNSEVTKSRKDPEAAKEAATAEASGLTTELHEARKRINDLESSLSWRLTGPLRSASKIGRRIVKRR